MDQHRAPDLNNSAASPGINRPGGWKRGLILVLLGVAAGLVWLNLRPKDGPTLALDLGNGVTMDLVRIGSGQFIMGSPDAENGHDSSESPQHTVVIAYPFYMGKFEVTKAQWAAVNSWYHLQGDGNLPIESVSWEDAQGFCQELSKRTGRHVRLPSEAEWEYACRAGTSTPFSFGSSLSSTQANFNGNPYPPVPNAPKGPNLQKTVPGGQYPANAWGLYDMHGNVWEWCQDVFHNDYHGAPADGSAWMTGGDDSHNHIYRGGGWDNDGANLRSAIRYAGGASDDPLRKEDLGFRVVVEARSP